MADPDVPDRRRSGARAAAHECARACALRAVDEDGFVSLPNSPSTIVEAVESFFAEHGVASLRLPSGWFGRPHDNMHQLSGVAVEGQKVVVTLDAKQVLTLDAEGASVDGRVLRVPVRGGRWNWTEYGGDRQHSEMLNPGDVEFHAFFHN